MAITKNLFVDQGSTFTITLTASDAYGNAISLSGSTGYAQFRKSFDSSYYYNIEVTNLTTQGLTGQFVLTISATASSDANPGRYVWDIEHHYNTGVIYRSYQGLIDLDAEVTKI